jgi:hypothetical protein
MWKGGREALGARQQGPGKKKGSRKCIEDGPDMFSNDSELNFNFFLCSLLLHLSLSTHTHTHTHTHTPLVPWPKLNITLL